MQLVSPLSQIKASPAPLYNAYLAANTQAKENKGAHVVGSELKTLMPTPAQIRNEGGVPGDVRGLDRDSQSTPPSFFISGPYISFGHFSWTQKWSGRDGGERVHVRV